jgi:ATP-dependent helicase/nuclease subunit A
MTTRSTTTQDWPHLVIRASAGSGKTFQLSNRFLELVAAGQPADTILATTFTRAAAAEIQDRILLRIAKAAVDDRERNALAGFLKLPNLSRTECLELLAGLARNLHRLRVGTLDSFFIQIARSFSWELGLPAGWRILDELEDARLRDEAVAEVLADDDRAALTRLVQWLTKGEAQRSLGELLDATVSKLYDLYREAPADAWSKIPRPAGLTAHELTHCIEELARLKLPTHKSIAKAHQGDLEAARAGDWDSFPLKGVAGAVCQGKDTYYQKPLEEDVVAVYSELLRHCVAVFLGKLAAQTEATRELLARFDSHYDRLKRQAGGLLFSDVTHLVGEWFRQRDAALKTTQQERRAKATYESLEQVAFRLDSHLNHLLLDEFQDTSLPQWNVLRPLAQRITSQRQGHSFFCVGDGKQAIYGWRGGVAEIFDALDQQLTGLSRAPLNESRRSSPVVIEFVNRIFRDMTQHDNLERSAAGVEYWSQEFPEHTTALKDYPGYVTLETGPAPDEESVDDEPLLTHAAQRIQQLVKDSPGASVGVLVRSNATIAKLIFRLRSLGVAASEEGGNALTDAAAVQLVVSALEFADHPGHSIAQLHLALSPLGRHLGLADVDRDPERCSTIAARIRQQLAADGYGRTIEQWAQLLAPSCDAREWRRLNQLVARAYAHDGNSTLRPSDFAAAVRKERAADPTSADVKVTTIHKSKGLQYDIVVLPDLATPLIGQPDGYAASRTSAIGPVETICRHVRLEFRSLLPPRLQEMFDQQDRQDTIESLCVLYVALTRAVHALHLIVAPNVKAEKSGLPRTFAGVLRAALTDGQPLTPLTTAFEMGDPKWFTRRKPKPVAAPTAPPPVADLRFAPLTGPRRRGLERVAPSALEGGRRVQLSSQFVGDGLLGRQKGTLFHAWFERITWLADGVPRDEELRAVAQRVLDARLSSEQLERWLVEFREVLQRPSIAAVLDRGFYPGRSSLTVYNERRFAIRRDDEIVSGVIDRLVTESQGGSVTYADIIDFKTDTIDETASQEQTRGGAISSPNTNGLAAKVDYYRPQLEAYRESVAQSLSLSLEQVTARLVFVSIGKVVAL